MRFSGSTLFAGLLAVGLASGCSDDTTELRKIDAALSAQEITTNYRGLSTGLANGIAFLDGSAMVKDLLRGDCHRTEADAPPQDCPEPTFNLDAEAGQTADWLAEHLFNPAHHVAGLSSDTAAVFCLKANDICEDDMGGLDPDCVQVLADVPVCVRVTSKAQGEYDLQVLLGKRQEMVPLEAHVAATRVTAEVRLAAVKASAEAIVAAQGAPLSEDWPVRVAGKIGFELAKLSEKSVSAKLAVLEAVEVDLYAAADVRRTEVRVDVAPRLIEVTLDGDSKQVKASADLKAVDLKIGLEALLGDTTEVCTQSSDPSMPPDCEVIEKHYTGTLLARLAGLSHSFRLGIGGESPESMSFENLGLGDGTTSVRFRDANGQTSDLFKVDFNAALSRRVNLTLTKQADGVLVQVKPGFDLVVAHDLRAIAQQFTDLKGWALKAVSEVKLTGTDPSILVRNTADDGSGGGLQVKAGSLELKATDMLDGRPDVNVVVNAPQCVSESADPLADVDHPFKAVMADVCQP